MDGKKMRRVGMMVLFGLLMAGGWLVIDAARSKADKGLKTQGLVMATSLATAVENFHGEYHALPDVGVEEVDTASPEGVRLLEALLGLEDDRADAQNSRRIIFLQGKEAKGKKDGIAYGDGDSIVGLYDPYGNSYRVVLNSMNEDILEFRNGEKQVALRGKQVAVWSVSKDGQEGTKDDVKSWN